MSPILSTMRGWGFFIKGDRIFPEHSQTLDKTQVSHSIVIPDESAVADEIRYPAILDSGYPPSADSGMTRAVIALEC
jgi:hypothetical protein